MKSHKLLVSTIATALVSSVAIPTMTQANTVQFKDVNTNAYYYNDIQWLVQKGIINGYPDGTYHPNEVLSREQAASMFVRALDLRIPANAASLIDKYKDINKNSWSAGALSAFINAGISNDTTNFYPTKPLTREVMASWLVGAFKFKEVTNESVPFKDLSQIASTHLSNVKILYQNDIVHGNTDGTYGPKSAVTRAQFATFMKRAITKYSGTEAKTGTGTGETNPDKSETTPLKLEDATSINLKQVKITTNQTIDNNQQIANKSLYKIEDENGNIIKVVDVQPNQKELTLTLEKAVKTSGKLIVDESVTGKEEDFRLSFRDNEEPKVVTLTPTSKNSYLLTFSEPLDFGVENGKELTNKGLLDSLEIDGYQYSIDKMTVQKYGKAIHVELDSNLREGAHELAFLKTDLFKDYAGNKLETNSFKFTMKYETTAPQLVKVKNVQANEITLVFDKQIKLRYRGYLYHTSSTHYPDSATVQNGNELVLTFADKDLLTKSTNIIVDSGAIEDLWGNKNTKITKAIEFAKDTTPPSITNVQFVDSTVANNSYIKMKVTFSESVKKDIAKDIDHYQLKDSQGNTIKIKDITFENSPTNDKIATFTIDKYYGEVPNQTFIIEADNIEDLTGNESGDFEYRFSAGSEKPPSDFTGKMILNDDEDEVRIVVDYGKKMAVTGTNSINQLDVYQLKVNGTTVLLDDLQNINGFNVSLTTDDDNEKAEILIEKRGELADAWDDFFDDLVDAVDYEDLKGVELIVGRVADENGNKTQSIVNNVKLGIQGEFNANQVTAKATDLDTIKLTFEDELVDFDDNDFVVFWDKDSDGKFDSNEVLDSSNSIKTANGSSVITFKLDDDELESDAKYDNKTVYVATDGKIQTKNRYGQTIEIKNLKVQDGIAPKIDTYRGTEQVYVQAIRNDSSRAIVTIEFTDDIDKDTLTRLSFVIGDGKKYEIESAFVESSDKICLVVNLNDNSVSKLVGEYVKQNAAISDENDNIISGIDIRINEEKSSRTNP